MPNTTEEKLEGARSVEKQLVHAQEINKHVGSTPEYLDVTAKKLNETQEIIDNLEKQLKEEGEQ